MNGDRGNRFLAILHKMKRLDLQGALNLMPPSEMMLLSEMRRRAQQQPEQPVKVSDIAKALDISPPAVSRTLNRLEEKRYIERLVDRGDRRNVCLQLTAAGEDAIRENMNKVKSFLEDALLYLSDDEIAQLTALFEKMYEAMKAQINKMERDKENGGLC